MTDDTGGSQSGLARPLIALVAVVVVAAVVALLIWNPLRSRADDSGPTSGSWGYIGQKLPRDRVIVFLHGTLGNASGTWKNTDTGAYWPEMVRTDDLFNGKPWRSYSAPKGSPTEKCPPANVFVCEYPAGVLSNFSVTDAAHSVYQQLRDVRTGVLRDHKEVLFVCHSMGGLVALELIERFGDNRTDPFVKKVKVLYLVATPGDGSEVANLGAGLINNRGWKDMRRLDSGGFLNDLKKRWKDFCREFDLPVICAFEKNATFGVVIVPEGSAIEFASTGYEGFGCIGIDDNHLSIAKPADRRAKQYGVFANAYATLDVATPPDEEVKVRIVLDRAAGVVPFPLTARVETISGPKTQLDYTWYFKSKKLDSTGPSAKLTVDEEGTHEIRILAKDSRGRPIEHKTTIKGIKPAPRIKTTQVPVRARIVTTHRDARVMSGDSEIDSDDWTHLDVSYVTSIEQDGKRVAVTITWNARELERNRKFKTGNTHLRSQKRAVVWTARPGQKALSVLRGARGRGSFFVKGRCNGFRTYRSVASLSRLEICFDERGSDDHRKQALRGYLDLKLLVQTR